MSEKLNYEAKALDFFAFLDLHNLDLHLLRYPNQNGRWQAKVNESWVKEKGALIGKYGTGTSPESAIKDYLPMIKGQLLVISQDSSSRRDIQVPDTITLSNK